MIDPTENVKALTEAAVKRLDDLAELRFVFLQSSAEMRENHTGEMRTMRAYYENLMRESEKGRLDAIRIIDITAVARAADDANERANTLAAQQLAQAEALRAQVAQTAAAFEAKLTTTIEPINNAIARLTQAQYEAQGQKTQIVESRDTAADFKPILDAISTLQREQQSRDGQQVQKVETRDSNRFYMQMLSAAVAASVLFQVYQSAKP